jgi:hypothetical protein
MVLANNEERQIRIWSRLYLDRRSPEDVTAELEGMLV